ncbi:transposase [Lacticaseibacillus zeae]|nr:transposase [Lacticaseibacillus zeae]OFR90734.1 hypothetical protein HMPREF2861_13485 [Lactobacillus sp. HMSC068F07]
MLIPDNLDELKQLLWQTTALAFRYYEHRQFILDIDSTYLYAFSNQVITVFNAHHMIKSITHKLSLKIPAVCYWILGRDREIQILMPTSLSKERVTILKHLPHDSGFAVPAFYGVYVSRSVLIVRSRASNDLKTRDDSLRRLSSIDDEENKFIYHKLRYQASWQDPYQMVTYSVYTVW